MLKLSSAYCSFVNGGKLIEPKLIDRIQDSEGNTIYKTEVRKCKNCEDVSIQSNDVPEIKDDSKQIFSSQTAYQITSILEGATKTGTAKKLRDLKMWKPENYGKKFYWPSTLRMGLEKSRNLMTVRISQDLGLKKITKISKELGIYENPNELLSISLGSAETTLLKLTSAYCSFVNGGKLIEPKLIDRIQDSEGNTIYKTEVRKCKNCEDVSIQSNDVPEIKDDSQQIFSPQTAYQITSILEGATKTGTAKKLRDLKMDLAGKTGTTNKNTDTWFIGFTSDLVIGVYVGYDEPKSLGKFETGAKTEMPIFKSFIKSALKKENTRPFKVPENITMMVVDSKTGKKVNFASKKTLIESFKSNKNLEKTNISKKINNRFNNNNILRFY